MTTESTASSQVPTGDAHRPYMTDSVCSADGAVIGYRQFGHGPGLVLLHGAMQSSHNLVKLAELLADSFTVYVPDRRGRGMSGPFRDPYSIQEECEDLDALLRKTNTHFAFGLSSGAIITLKAASQSSALQKIALYEPPLPLDEHSPILAWISPYERAIAQGNLAAAFVSIVKGTGDPSIMTHLPRFVLVPLFQQVFREAARKTVTQGEESDQIPLPALVPTVYFDTLLVREMTGKMSTFHTLPTEVLLLGGTKSSGSLKTALASLSAVLPQTQRVTLPGVGHTAADSTEKPEVVARELRRFFGELR
jgi:pimeloyl-ACP methyl ester carboxylesterase